MLKRFLIAATVLACAFAVAESNADAGQKLASLKGQQQNLMNCVNVSESNIQHILYTREKPEGEIVIANRLNLGQSSINVKKRLKVILHSRDQDKNLAKPVVRDYLYSQNVDVLILDWSAYSRKCNSDSIEGVVTPFLGKTLSEMLGQIIAIGHSSERMHLIGFGYGAHIAGIAGQYMAPHLPDRITALDPLKFEKIDYPGPYKLTAGDAKFVDVIVTSIPHLASEEELGLVSFYPDGGLTDYHHNCNDLQDLDKVYCGHLFAFKLFAESLESPKKFAAVKCDNYQKFLDGKCNEELVAHMGEFVEKNARGRYYLSTNKNSPFDKGLNP